MSHQPTYGVCACAVCNRTRAMASDAVGETDTELSTLRALTETQARELAEAKAKLATYETAEAFLRWLGCSVLFDTKITIEWVHSCAERAVQGATFLDAVVAAKSRLAADGYAWSGDAKAAALAAEKT